MIGLDSIRLEIGSDGIRDIDLNSPNLLMKTTRGAMDEGIVSEIVHTKESPCIGLKFVSYSNSQHSATVDLSAKILKERYIDLINPNTIERAFEEINKHSPITFNIPVAVDIARVRAIDCTNNLRVEQEPQRYIDALMQVRANDKYNITFHRDHGNSGVVMAGRQRSFKERQILYVKSLEILKDKRMAKEPYFGAVIRDHNGILRVESNYTSFDRIRKCTGSVDLLLNTVMNSTENPNLALFNKITNRVPDCQLMLQLERGKFAGMSLHQIEKRIGMEGIIRELDFDMQRIVHFINSARSKKSKNSKVIREYRNLLTEIMPTEGNVIQLRNLLIEEIKLKLAS